MIHKGVEYTVAVSSEPDTWQWWFQIGDIVKTGSTNTRLAGMAARRVQLRIDRALRSIEIPIPVELQIAPGLRLVADTLA